MKHFLLIFFLSFTLKSYAQELFFDKPAAFQNLPSVETYQILQDKKGFIWITTDAGLCRYDGSVLTTFTVKDGISENVVLKGYEDKKGRIWFTTLSGYFFYYFNNRFHTIAANEELKRICLSSCISSFYIGEKDTLFCTSPAIAAVLKIPPQQNYKHLIRMSKGYEKCNRFCYINKSDKSEALFGRGEIGALTVKEDLANCNGTIIRLNYKPINIQHSKNGRGGIDKDENIYLPFGPQLLVYRKSTATIDSYDFPGIIISIYQDKDADLWIGTTQGGYLYKHSDLSSKPISFLHSLSISSVLLDRENSVWVATTQKGIFKSNSKEILLFKEKACFFQKDNKQLNIACNSKKIVSIFKNDSIHIDNSFSKFLHPINELLSAFIDQHYSYYNTGSILYVRKTKDTSSLHFVAPIAANEILKIDPNTLCIISPKELSIVVKNKLLNRFTPSFAIRSSTQLKDKTILIGSRSNSGIYEFKHNTFIPYLAHLPQLKTRINCMVEDSAGNLWIATNEHGLYCLDQYKKLHVFNSVPDKLNSLVLDNQSNLWAAANNALIKLDYSKGLRQSVVSTFSQSNGLPNFQIEKLIEFNGNIWCNTNEHFFYFKSDRLTLNKTPPLVYIDRVSINNKPLHFTSNTIRLQHHENNIHIQSTLIANKNTSKKEFLYKLSGYDDSWHYSSLGDIQYTNLDHGTYHFVVYGLNNNGLKSILPAGFTFIIDKPFWFTWWFILLEVVFISIFIYFYLTYWKNKIEKREQEKASANQKMTEFKMTALRSQMNPHFIFNAIGSIQHYILKNEIKQSYNYLSKFSMLIRNILINSRDEYIFLSQEINTLRLYIELEQIRFTNPFKFIIEIDEQLDMNMDIPTMLIQPYVENSIWHGLMSKELDGVLEIHFKKVNDTLLVLIRDNGVGRKRKSPSQEAYISKGMSITEQRIQTLEATNQKKFSVTIIDLKDEQNNPIGTEVNLIIPLYI